MLMGAAGNRGPFHAAPGKSNGDWGHITLLLRQSPKRLALVMALEVVQKARRLLSGRQVVQSRDSLLSPRSCSTLRLLPRFENAPGSNLRNLPDGADSTEWQAEARGRLAELRA